MCALSRKSGADITYIRLEKGFAYLAAIIDQNTKKILLQKLSNTIDLSLTTGVLKDILVKNSISIPMDVKGRSIDNIVIERF